MEHTMRYLKRIGITSTWAILAVFVGIGFGQVGTAVKNGFRDCAGVNCDNVFVVGGTLEGEGATADAFETSITFDDPVADRAQTWPNVAGRYVVMGLIAGGATETVVATTHAGACVALDTAAGTTVTMPAATGTGNRYCFEVTVTPTSLQHRIDVVGNDEYVGGVVCNTDAAANAVQGFEAADAGDNDRFDMNGTTKGGRIGDVLWFTDISTDNWSVSGFLNCSGTEASPFTAGAVT